jgi:hypothetical protein
MYSTVQYLQYSVRYRIRKRVAVVIIRADRSFKLNTVRPPDELLLILVQ